MRVALLGEFAPGSAARLRTAGHGVASDSAEGSVAAAAEGADLVVTRLADDRDVRRVYAELARTASAGQVFVDLTPAAAATHDRCALALPAFVSATSTGEFRGERAHLARARPVLDVLTAPDRLP